jgi:hypothetical protein
VEAPRAFSAKLDGDDKKVRQGDSNKPSSPAAAVAIKHL